MRSFHTKLIRSHILFLLLFFFVSSLRPSSPDAPFPPPINSSNQVSTALTPTRYIPSVDLEEKGIFLNNAVSISIDPQENIFIANSKEGNILKFDSKGTFLSKIGTFGQGPGEFEFPMKVYQKGDSLFVLDSLRGCLQVFDKNGAALRQIRLFRSYVDFIVNSGGFIFVARSPKAASDFLVDVLDVTGNLQFSFGNPIIDKEYPPGTANNIRIAANENDDVFILFQITARLQKYDKTGLLLNDIQISNENIRKDLIYNKKQFDQIRQGNRVGYHHIIETARVYNDTVYILRNGDRRIEIFEIGKSSRVEKSLHFPVAKDYYAMDFDLIKKQDQVHFYVLEIAPECRVAVLTKD